MLKGHAKVLVLAAAVLTASCLDFDDPLTMDPVGVNPSETEEPMVTASSASQSASPPSKRVSGLASSSTSPLPAVLSSPIRPSW